MLIGLTGKYAAGKGTVAELLKEQGFAYHSCSDILREGSLRGVPGAEGARRWATSCAEPAGQGSSRVD